MAMTITGDRAHRGEHARIFYPAAFELLDTIRSRTFSRSIAIAGAIIQIRQATITGPPEQAVLELLRAAPGQARDFRTDRDLVGRGGRI